jgi:hypothetical protein
MLKDYKPEDIFNGDEFGLFWRLPPNKTFIVKGQTYKTGKKAKKGYLFLFVQIVWAQKNLNPLLWGGLDSPVVLEERQQFQLFIEIIRNRG